MAFVLHQADPLQELPLRGGLLPAGGRVLIELEVAHPESHAAQLRHDAAHAPAADILEVRGRRHGRQTRHKGHSAKGALGQRVVTRGLQGAEQPPEAILHLRRDRLVLTPPADERDRRRQVAAATVGLAQGLPLRTSEGQPIVEHGPVKRLGVDRSALNDWSTCRDCPCLVQDDRVEFRRCLQRGGALDQAAPLRSDACGDHDGHRCGQPHRARASDHQHGHAELHREQQLQGVLRLHLATLRHHVLHVVAHRHVQRDCHDAAEDERAPNQERHEGEPHDGRHEYPGYLVGRPLNVRLARLRLLNERDHLPEHGVRPGPRHPHQAAARRARRTAVEAVPSPLRNGLGLPGEQALVDVDGAVRAHLPIDGDLGAREDAQHVVDLDELDGYGPVAPGLGRRRCVGAKRCGGRHARRQVGHGPDRRQFRSSL
mmetsp:Transcript_88708/g.255811  ORF Transcript_88708/g.255811 Transcript_88708/m.255811 type:complete len:429 (+) Transcript_88708:801-2087(+)